MQQQFMEMYRASLRSAAEVLKASLEQTERMQQQQLQLVHSALEETTRSATQLTEMKNLDDMMALNSRLAGAQLERMADLWSGMWRAAGDAQKTMIDQMQSQMGHAKERVRESYAFTTRTSEDAARLAAAQVTGVVREAQERSKSAAQEPQHRKSA
jgi:hypothetical protein